MQSYHIVGMLLLMMLRFPAVGAAKYDVIGGMGGDGGGVFHDPLRGAGLSLRSVSATARAAHKGTHCLTLSLALSLLSKLSDPQHIRSMVPPPHVVSVDMPSVENGTRTPMPECRVAVPVLAMATLANGQLR